MKKKASVYNNSKLSLLLDLIEGFLKIERFICVKGAMISILAMFFFSSCSTSKNYEKLEWAGESSARIVKLTDDEVKEDLDILLYALDKSYIGGDYTPVHIYSSFIDKIKASSKLSFQDNVDFCKHLGKAFLLLPDGHFSIWFPGHGCYDLKVNYKDVGKNYGLKSENPAYSFYKIRRNISLLSIKKFLNRNAEEWSGFSEAIAKAARDEYLIIDLRGNGGGDSGRGLELARTLLNDSIEHNRKKIIRKNTPESWTIYRNNMYRKKIWGRHKNYPMNLEIEINIADKKRRESINSDKEFLSWESSKPNLGKINYKGKIFILMDKKCGSSCEHTIEALKFHPNTITVGDNTAGAIHYGQMGLLRLPNSGIYLLLATQYFELFESGYFDKVGYSPDIEVPKGEDALTFLLKKISSRSK